MTREAICKMLESVGFPLAYEVFGEGQKFDPPYMVYSYPQNHPFYADGVIYAEIDQLQINLYTRVKDPEAEKKVEATLIEHEMEGFQKHESYYPDENIFEIRYELEVYINNE